MKRHIRPVAKANGINKNIGWHTFRHSFGILPKANGEDVKTVQELLRHAHSRITLDVYTQAVSNAELQILKIDVAPAKSKQLADPKSSCGIEKSQSLLPHKQLAEEELEFGKFEYLRHLLPFRTLTDKYEWVAVNPLIPHRVMEDCAHDISDLRSCPLGPLDAVQPVFNSD
jgi:hypothetical protein